MRAVVWLVLGVFASHVTLQLDRAHEGTVTLLARIRALAAVLAQVQLIAVSAGKHGTALCTRQPILWIVHCDVVYQMALFTVLPRAERTLMYTLITVATRMPLEVTHKLEGQAAECAQERPLAGVTPDVCAQTMLSLERFVTLRALKRRWRRDAVVRARLVNVDHVLGQAGLDTKRLFADAAAERLLSSVKADVLHQLPT